MIVTAYFSCWCSGGTQDICVPYFLLEGSSGGEAPHDSGAVSACDSDASTASHGWP